MKADNSMYNGRGEYRKGTPANPERYGRCLHSIWRSLFGAGKPGFRKTSEGSHHLFRKAGIEERINLQRDGNHAKPYQVKQVRGVILKHKLSE